ncbi:hypothetical protein LG201_04095 [Methylobacillus gramineus]|uniref:dienelactone hydrolase family protein n=1 Tax=Methylobacillus gramineus TaxID=755169 RepID=UPI001D000007|nr:alpha/beta family hydrolase [Methylobacillus gramineus]MCB5184381.1 hypothetical protein [Methylobacillus gramineus]
MNRSPISISILAGLLVVSSAHAEQSFKLVTPRGLNIEVLEDKPVGAGPYPVVILASGSSYDARQPLQEQLARQLLSEGFATLRFNWAYQVQHSAQGKPSDDRLNEIEDMQTVLAYARKQAWVDSKQIVAAGKSLGSIISWRVFSADPDIKAAILLTPVCRTPPGIDVQYVNAPQETRPSLWLLGDRDPVCATNTLYSYLGRQANQARISVVDGNHILALEEKQPAASSTLELAARITSRFVATVTGK